MRIESNTMPTQTVEHPSAVPQTRSAGTIVLLTRVQGEYREMPGLRLTEAQARRLWNLDENTCGVVLATLTRRGFLERTPNGMYVRASV